MLFTIFMNIQEDTLNYLKATGMTQQELSKQIGVHWTSLCRYLNKGENRPLHIAEKLALVIYQDTQHATETR